ncbi:MAG: ferritin [Actinobacteria bacterium]|uniref:Unannotated protein n=1 Tax=freshwater metagenome TaxID=449393 RepID=A0A6J6A3K3_9ZZZZ|nr:ferritin [Actinomycetota bacterium]
MTSTAFADAVNEQIGHEYAAHQQYVAIAVFYDSKTLPYLAQFFYKQALEERGHAMMMVQYLLDQDAGPIVPGISPPKTDFDDISAPVALALEQEKTVTKQINAMAAVARDENDFAGEQFIQWFIKEQVEEVSSMSDLLTVVERLIDTPMQIEDHLARELAGATGGGDPTEPSQAGGAGA